MKRFLSGVAVVTVALAPVMAQASVFVSGNEYNRGVQERVGGNLYAAGGMVSVASEVSGDLLIGGGTISVTGHVGSDVAIVGGNIQVLGSVGDDMRIMGGMVTISDRVGGDLLVAGGTVHLLSSAVVVGDVYAAGGQVVIDGTVQGSVHTSGGRLTINGTVGGDVRARVNDVFSLGSDARINGALWYRSPHEVSMAPGAKVSGTVTYDPASGFKMGAGAAKTAAFAVLGVLTAMQMLAFLGMTALLVWRHRRWSLAMLQEAADGFWPSVGKGLVYMILVPIGAVLLLISFVGSLPGVLALLTYVAVSILAKVMAGMLLGAWLAMKVAKRSVLEVTWANALGGVVLLQLLMFVPILGWIAQVVLMLAVFGVLARSVQRQLSVR